MADRASGPQCWQRSTKRAAQQCQARLVLGSVRLGWSSWRSTFGVDDEHGAGSPVGRGLGHAPEYPTYSLHAFVADHDEICPLLLGHLDDGFGRTAPVEA